MNTRVNSSVADDIDLEIRRAVPADAALIASIIERISAERRYSAIDRPWSVDAQREYLSSLSIREAFHVAVVRGDDIGTIVGFQSLDLWSRTLTSMSHVAQIGTFLLPQWRHRGLGTKLYGRTEAFARANDFRKIVAQIRASNTAALSFYSTVGFIECGRLSRQVVIDDKEDDEVIMERFL